jgi:hypothetical protein
MCAYFREPDIPCSQALALVLFKKDRYRRQFSCILTLALPPVVPTQWILV